MIAYVSLISDQGLSFVFVFLHTEMMTSSFIFFANDIQFGYHIIYFCKQSILTFILINPLFIKLITKTILYKNYKIRQCPISTISYY